MDFSLPDEDSEDSEDEENFLLEPEVLNPQYIPKEMPHRDNFRKEIYENLIVELSKGNQPSSNYMITGAPGSGKTKAVESVLEGVKRENDAHKLKNFKVVYVNCSTNPSHSGVLKQIAKKVGVEWKRGISKSENSKNLFQAISDIDKPMLIILDELNELRRKSGRNYINGTLKALSRPHQYRGVENKVHFNLIMITNDVEVLDLIDDDNESMLSYKKMEARSYLRNEIVDILKVRQEKAFTEELLSEEALEKIADEVFSVFDSDVRKAIKILNEVPEIYKESPRSKHDNVSETKLVRKALNRFKSKYVQQHLEASPEHSVLLFHSYLKGLDKGEAKQKEIRDRFEKMCVLANLDDKSDAWVRRELNNMVENKVLRRSRDSSISGAPFKYQLNIAKRICKKKVEDRMKRLGIADELNESLEMEKNEVKKEAESKLNEMMGE